MAKTYSVKAPLVIAKSEQGADLYLYEGAAVPEGQSDDWISRHLDDDMIVAGEYVPDAPKAESSGSVAASDEKPAKASK